MFRLFFTKQFLVTNKILAKLAQKQCQETRFFLLWGKNGLKEREDQNLILGRFGDS